MKEHFTDDGKTAICGKRVWDWRLGDEPRWIKCMDCKEILLSRLPDGPWEMYACYDGERFSHPGTKLYVENCCTSEETIVEVLVEKVDDGEYWGWQDLGDNEPHMIWGSHIQFKMCFGGGYERNVKEKRGRVVRLKITAF